MLAVEEKNWLRSHAHALRPQKLMGRSHLAGYLLGQAQIIEAAVMARRTGRDVLTALPLSAMTSHG